MANGKAGRPDSYSPELEIAVCEALSQGAPIKIACDFAGISIDTYYEWRKRHVTFAEATTRARARQVVRNLELIQKAAPQDWRAADAALRLTHPDQFAASRARLDIKVGIEEEQADRLFTLLESAFEAAGMSPAQRKLGFTVIEMALAKPVDKAR